MSAQQPEVLPQVSTMMGELVKHQRYFENLSIAARQWVIKSPKNAIAVMIEAINSRGPAQTPSSEPWIVDGEGNIHFTLTSNGRTPEQWEQYLDCRGWFRGEYGRDVLRLASEAPTNGMKYHIVIHRVRSMRDSDHLTNEIDSVVSKRGWKKPHWEVACLIRDTFTDEAMDQMGLWCIATMHEPIKDSNDVPRVLASNRSASDDGWFGPEECLSDTRWGDVSGLAYVVSQVSSYA